MSDWTHVRVRVGTRDWLREECEKIVQAIQAGHMDPPEEYNPDPINPQCCGLSFNAMLELLLYARLGHRQRRRKSKRGGRKPAPPQAGQSNDPGS